MPVSRLCEIRSTCKWLHNKGNILTSSTNLVPKNFTTNINWQLYIMKEASVMPYPQFAGVYFPRSFVRIISDVSWSPASTDENTVSGTCSGGWRSQDIALSDDIAKRLDGSTRHGTALFGRRLWSITICSLPSTSSTTSEARIQLVNPFMSLVLLTLLAVAAKLFVGVSAQIWTNATCQPSYSWVNIWIAEMVSLPLIAAP